MITKSSGLSTRNLIGRKVHSIVLRVGFQKFVDQYRVLIERQNCLDKLGNIECSTLIVAAQEDTTTPLEENIKIADRIPGSKFVVLKNCSHMAMLDQPDLVSEELKKWLD